MVYRHTGISLQPYTELRNIYFKMQKKKMKLYNLIDLFSMKWSSFFFHFLSSCTVSFASYCSPLCLFNFSVWETNDPLNLLY